MFVPRAGPLARAHLRMGIGSGGRRPFRVVVAASFPSRSGNRFGQAVDESALTAVTVS
jgi:hypothetical protein